MGHYLYAVTADTTPASPPMVGLFDAPVYTVVEDGIAAVVSDFEDVRLRPERKHLTAHQQVLRHLLSAATPLPMRFGLVSAGEKATRKLLKRFHEDLSEQLVRVEGRVEMGLKVRWDVPNVFEHLLQADPSLAELRDQIRDAESGGTVLHQQRIELGRRVEAAIEQEREQTAARVSAVLESVAVEIHAGVLRTETELLNFSCLIDKEREDEFGDRVVEAAAGFDGSYAFDYNGPWAPHNFVSLDLEL
ncbi:MAG: GvpL/GvpF family gas vesicle protein [Acidobacteria bacterium]|nr:GvpL/GvpF family gas vesicle protein [Acidobacteriota bacterium]